MIAATTRACDGHADFGAPDDNRNLFLRRSNLRFANWGLLRSARNDKFQQPDS
jgi:hypothetical protein